MPSLYIIGQWGPEAAERCYGPFVTGTTAQAQDVDANIFLMMDAVMLMKKGMAEKVKAPGFPPLPDLIDAFLESGRTTSCDASSMLSTGSSMWEPFF